MALQITESDNDTVVKGLNNFNLESILECGQCFRWDKNEFNDYTGIVGNKAVRIIQKEDTAVFYNCTVQDFTDYWLGYFDMETDYGKIIEKLTSCDDVMKKAALYAPGIRILRQPLFETLITFIISANNSIPNIRRVVASLSAMYGSKINYDGNERFTFPEPAVLAKARIDEISLSKAGFRSKYIKNAAFEFSNNPFSIKNLKAMGYDEAKNKLMKYPGVGSKVADCTLLFSGAYMNAFPVDVWVKKIMEELYLQKDTPLKLISEFAQKKFNDLGGYAQQYLFYYARSNM